MLQMEGHSDRVTSLAMHGGLLFSCSYDGTVRRWNALTGECLEVLQSTCRRSPLSSLHLGARERSRMRSKEIQIVAAAFSGSVQVWQGRAWGEL